jgi:hypothetical protein
MGSGAQASPTASPNSRAGRFSFSNKLGGRFYENNTIMAATQKTVRKQRQGVRKACVLETEIERLHKEIEEVRIVLFCFLLFASPLFPFL